MAKDLHQEIVDAYLRHEISAERMVRLLAVLNRPEGAETPSPSPRGGARYESASMLRLRQAIERIRCF